MANLPNISEGITHIASYTKDEEIESCINAVNLTTSSPGKSPGPALRILSDCHSALCLKSLIVDKNIMKSKWHAYVSAFCQRLVIQLKPYDQAYAQGFDLLYPLISDNKQLLDWHSQYELSNFFYDRKTPRAINTEKYEYHSVQPRLALQKNWALLVERSELVLANPFKKNKFYIIDHQFYIALANGDTIAMEQAIHELISPKIARHRNKELQRGLERRLINGWGVILTKLAYYLGYELNVDSQWIPQEWLPVKPLDDYNLPYDFLQKFELYTPFEAESGLWCGDVTRFSPRLDHDNALTFQEIESYL
jgi:hypothetical protein